MSVKTPDDLARFLRDDLGWRRKENHVYRSLALRPEHITKQAVLRGAVAVLYAHWEGFVKLACRAYYEYVRLLKLRNSELCFPLLGLAIRYRLRSVQNSGNLDSHAEFGAWLLREWDRRATLPRPDDLFGTSNLNKDVFRSFMLGLNLPYPSDFQIAEQPVIERVVTMRNQLAHGSWVIIEQNEYEELLVGIERLMSHACDLIENAAYRKEYRRNLGQLI